ncbi:MAG: hypothetical protein HC831_08195 [Chloroflexia bacterium]|nr:hypothetical protein [Chloroflexia bacterium]
MKIAILLLITLFSSFTMKAQNHQHKNNNMTLEYSDGNGNYYKITVDSIIYNPITKEMSSSGLYDGGDPVEKSITKVEFLAIRNEFEAIFNKKEIHIQHRMKTSGRLAVNKGQSNEKQVIIKRSDEQEKLEKLLKSLLTD